MVDILDELKKYVPYDVNKCLSPIAFAGDYLTVARARTAQEIRVTSVDENSLRGFTFFAGDWHAKQNYAQVS